MWEAVASLRLLLDPCRAPLHLPWLDELRDGRLSELDLRTAAAMLPAEGYIPDFLTPPPTGPLVGFEEERETVCAASAAQVRRDVEITRGGRTARRALEPLLKEPKRALGRLSG